MAQLMDADELLTANCERMGVICRQQETEKGALRSALIEERSRYCLFVACLKPVMVILGPFHLIALKVLRQWNALPAGSSGPRRLPIGRQPPGPVASVASKLRALDQSGLLWNRSLSQRNAPRAIGSDLIEPIRQLQVGAGSQTSFNRRIKAQLIQSINARLLIHWIQVDWLMKKIDGLRCRMRRERHLPTFSPNKTKIPNSFFLFY